MTNYTFQRIKTDDIVINYEYGQTLSRCYVAKVWSLLFVSCGAEISDFISACSNISYGYIIHTTLCLYTNNRDADNLKKFKL
jgi:hypothetical protein